MRPTRYLNCVIPRRIVCQCSTVQLVLQRVFRKPAPMQHHTGLTEYIRGIVQWIRVEQDEISDLTAFDPPLRCWPETARDWTSRSAAPQMV